jgi:hypothetical protein
MSRFTLALLALIVAGGCGGRDATAPSSTGMTPGVGISADRSTSHSRNRITYEKWIAGYPAMVGNANGVLGAFTGTILTRTVSADGFIIHLKAEYVIAEPRTNGQSFTTVIEGDEDLHTQNAVLTGIVTEGWRKGAPVLVTFDVLTPCTVATAPVGTKTCFRGIIRIGEQDDDRDEER